MTLPKKKIKNAAANESTEEVACRAQRLQGPALTTADELFSRAEAVVGRLWAVSSKGYTATT